jgi:ribosome-binding factor A
MTRHTSRSRNGSAREGSERGAGFRGQRLEELFREELNSLLEIEINDPTLEGARVTLAELSRDGSRARIWFALASGQDAARALTAFERAGGFLRSRLCDALPIKRIPELTFRYDPVATFESDDASAPDVGDPNDAALDEED